MGTKLNKIYGRFVQNKAGSGAVGRLPSRFFWLCRTFSGGGPGNGAGAPAATAQPGCPSGGRGRAQGVSPKARPGAPRGPEHPDPHRQRPPRGGPTPGSGPPAMGGPDQPPTSTDKADPHARGRRGRPGARSAEGRRGPQAPEAGPPHKGGPGAVQLRAASACGWGGAHRARAARAPTRRAAPPGAGAGRQTSGRAVACGHRQARPGGRPGGHPYLI